MEKLNLIEKNVYGIDLLYPHCEKSKLIAELISKKTFSGKELEILTKLGYEINIINAIPKSN